MHEILVLKLGNPFSQTVSSRCFFNFSCE